MYTRLMSIFARLPGGAEAALGLFERMGRRGIQPDVVAFNCAIGAAGMPSCCLACATILGPCACCVCTTLYGRYSNPTH